MSAATPASEEPKQTGEKKKCKPCCMGKKMFKPQELPIYTAPAEKAIPVVASEPCELQKGIKAVRLAVTPTLIAAQQVKDRGVEIVNTAIEHSRPGIEYVSDKDNAKLLSLGLGGLAGIVLARRGLIRRTLLGSIGVGIASAYAYPTEFQKYKTQSFDLVKQTTGYDLADTLKDVHFPNLFAYIPEDVLSFGWTKKKEEEPKSV